MAKNLVIVESPAKAKTIEGFLGKDYTVVSSFGHIRDLSSKNMGIDVENDFTPDYQVSADKKDIVKKLIDLAKKSEMVWLATDEDREGEAIAWHLAETLNLNETNTKRIVFHEITKTAILKAVENPRTINYALVNAQQARRVLDRLVGFELSPVLWRKVKQGLSAGRVQSVSVRLIVEREREIQQFNSESAYRVIGEFETQDSEIFQAELPKRFKTEAEAYSFAEKCAKAVFSVSSLEKRPGKKSPSSPFTTSTLQQEASRKLGYSVAQTMRVAQKLYESGKITYMRTDSLNLSEGAIASAEEMISTSFGKEYSNPRRFNTKSKGAQEAHEAIRPTDMNEQSAGTDNQEEKLYDLIWKRTIASQMAEAKLERTTVHINIDTQEQEFVAKGEVIIFDGFLKVYMEGSDDESEEQKGMLPKISEGEILGMQTITATERFSKHAARYTEASLVKKMEELGIGRPSTYAPTISTIQRREYIIKDDREGTPRAYKSIRLVEGQVVVEELSEMAGAEKKKLFPTDIGLVVNDFLVENFGQILDFHFTAKVEEEFDEIADGQRKWNSMIADFYKDFHLHVEDVKENSERAVGERLLGVDPKSGKNIYVRIGRFGPMAQLGESSTDKEAEKPTFASLRKTQNLETITFEEAIDLFKLPRDLGEYEGYKVVAAIGRFGPYVRHNSKFVSVKEVDPLDITLTEAIELIEAKRKADREKIISVFDAEEPTIEVLNGRWGPYIVIEKTNYKIPKETDAAKLTREECIEISKNQPKKKGKAKVTKAKTTAAKPAVKAKATKKKK
jgi:DNA topoisomerase-1